MELLIKWFSCIRRSERIVSFADWLVRKFDSDSRKQAQEVLYPVSLTKKINLIREQDRATKNLLIIKFLNKNVINISLTFLLKKLMKKVRRAVKFFTGGKNTYFYIRPKYKHIYKMKKKKFVRIFFNINIQLMGLKSKFKFLKFKLRFKFIKFKFFSIGFNYINNLFNHKLLIKSNNRSNNKSNLLQKKYIKI